jgi:hypothetical protein
MCYGHGRWPVVLPKPPSAHKLLVFKRLRTMRRVTLRAREQHTVSIGR